MSPLSAETFCAGSEDEDAEILGDAGGFGLPPSISTVLVTTMFTPLGVSSIEVITALDRIRAPTFTGFGKRNLFIP